MPREVKPKIEIVCQKCGRLFPVYPSLVKKQKYCNIDCANKGRIGNKNAKKKEGKMAKKSYVSLKGTSLGNVIKPDKHPGGKIVKTGLHPHKGSDKKDRNCRHYTLSRIERSKPIWKCQNPFCGLEFGMKKLKKERGLRDEKIHR